jgi:transcription elongation factor Elf1
MPKNVNAAREAMKASSSGVKARGHQFKVIDNNFDCPLCGGKQCVSVKVDAAKRSGTVRCRAPECETVAAFETSYLPKLEKPVDVFFRFYEDVRAAQRTKDNVVRNIFLRKATPGGPGAQASGSASIVLASPAPAVLSTPIDEEAAEDPAEAAASSSNDSELADLFNDE